MNTSAAIARAIKKTRKSVLDTMSYAQKKVIDAYHDCNDLELIYSREWDLSFMSDEAMDGNTWVNTMAVAIPQGYNEYETSIAKQVIKYYGENSYYFAAREYSVCVYVLSTKDEPPAGSFSADEISMQELPMLISNLKMHRIWWD